MEFLTGALKPSGIFEPLLQPKKETLNGFTFGQTGLRSLIPHCFLFFPEMEASAPLVSVSRRGQPQWMGLSRFPHWPHVQQGLLSHI